MATRQPCKECGRRPKYGTRQRCVTCLLRHEAIDVQVAACRRRLGMVPVELRRARVKPDLWPAGTRWCAGCQSFRDLEDMAGGGKGSRCRACQSWATHGAMLERTYDLTRAQYDELLTLQGGRCAICRAQPKSKRLAVDHDHKTGAVRGLLCSRCNHDLMGAAWDSEAMARALLGYVQRPPATGAWVPPEQAQPVSEETAAPRHGIVAAGGGSVSRETSQPAALVDPREWVKPIGGIKDPNRPGAWLVFLEPGAPPPF